jgi:hypothetical protein
MWVKLEEDLETNLYAFVEKDLEDMAKRHGATLAQVCDVYWCTEGRLEDVDPDKFRAIRKEVYAYAHRPDVVFVTQDGHHRVFGHHLNIVEIVTMTYRRDWGSAPLPEHRTAYQLRLLP